MTPHAKRILAIVLAVVILLGGYLYFKNINQKPQGLTDAQKEQITNALPAPEKIDLTQAQKEEMLKNLGANSKPITLTPEERLKLLQKLSQ